MLPHSSSRPACLPRPRLGAAVLAAAIGLAGAAVPALSSAAAEPGTAQPPTPLAQAARLTPPPAQRSGAVPGRVLVALADGTTITGAELDHGARGARAPHTNRPDLDRRLAAVGAESLRPVLDGAAPAGSPELRQTYVLQTRDRDAEAVARNLTEAPGVVWAAPDRYVNSMASGAQPLPEGAPTPHVSRAAKAAAGAEASAVPDNYGVATSAQALLNAGGVDALGVYEDLAPYHQLPGQGEIITNISIGDLTDQSMADSGDSYVQRNGPTTVMDGGQRYLDMPSMSRIPAYVATSPTTLSGSASTKDQDPALDEVMLDFSVMAPLPHDRQRPGATGSGYTDLLGIAPGASYRLVVPEEPTTEGIAVALSAAAHQTPRPSVITASLGFGTDDEGFPGRYLEDSPTIRALVESIVRSGIDVVISSNDGTRLYTPAAVGPDGGSTPTDLPVGHATPTTIDDDAESTTPSIVPDSGAIAAGGTTLDDTLAAGTHGAATTAESRISGFGTFSSGFGTRVDLSAPSDNVVSLAHRSGGGAGDVQVQLNGGTSASAPEIAAAAAVVRQAGRLAGRDLTPAQVRSLLETTARSVPTPAQLDRDVHVGPQVDVTAAFEKAIGLHPNPAAVRIARLGVMHRDIQGGLGGEFLETTDPDRIDLGDMAAGGSGERLVGPVTFAADVAGSAGLPLTYRLTVGDTVLRSPSPAIRITPKQLLAAAGLPVVSETDRQLDVRYDVLLDARVLATASRTLTVGPSDGAYVEAQAPSVPPTAPEGHSVTASYDLTGVVGLDDPYLVVSTVGHWSPSAGPIFSAAWSAPLADLTGTVTIPGDAFTGGGLYGVGIVTSGFDGIPAFTSYGEFAPIRIVGGTAAQRPSAPLLAGGDAAPGHVAGVTRAHPGFTVGYDVRSVPGAVAAEVEVSAPAPTLRRSLNTFTNANGTRLDDDGVDTGSVAHEKLAGNHGSARLDALALGLGTSDLYGIRVLALDAGGHVVGQASPVSTLYVDDGLAPHGSTVLSFGIAGEHSVVALRKTAGGTEIRHYAPATGSYGAVIASDGPGSDYEVVGASSDRVLLAHQAEPRGDVTVEVWDTLSDRQVGSRVIAADAEAYVTGAVDSRQDTAAVLLHRLADRTDLVLPVSMGDGTFDDVIAADLPGVTAGAYSILDIDESTGRAFLTKGNTGLICIGSVTVAAVGLVDRTVTPAGAWSGCSHGLADDDAGTLYNISANSFSANIVPTSVLTALDTTTGRTSAPMSIRQETPSTLAVDGQHHLGLVLYNSPAGRVYFGSNGPVVPDNNATSQLVVVDLSTGDIVGTVNGILNSRHGGALSGIGTIGSVQLDPATRTGWTFGPGDAQVKQFSY